MEARSAVMFWCKYPGKIREFRHINGRHHIKRTIHMQINRFRVHLTSAIVSRQRNLAEGWPKSNVCCCKYAFSNIACFTPFQRYNSETRYDYPFANKGYRKPTLNNLVKRQCSSISHNAISQYDTILKHDNFIFYKKNDDDREYRLEEFKASVLKDFILKENFVSDDEEKSISFEVQKALSRLKYEYDHWDGVICGYREVEKSRWTTDNAKIIQRIKDEVFDDDAVMLPGVHVLDLFKDGYIKPHVDSKFCGHRIAGLSLLSAAIMRLRPTDLTNYSMFVDVLLKPRSLYVMRNSVRYDLTHEILNDDVSFFGDLKVNRERRIAVIMREEPTT